MQPNYKKLLLQSNKEMMAYGDLEVLIMLNMHNSLLNFVPANLLKKLGQIHKECRLGDEAGSKYELVNGDQ